MKWVASGGVLLAMGVAAGAGTVSFTTNEADISEAQGFAYVTLQRTEADASAAVVINLDGNAEKGTDYEVYAVSLARNRSPGAGRIGTAIDTWGTNLVAATAAAWGPGGAVLFFDGSGTLLGTARSPTPDNLGLYPFSAEVSFGNDVAFLSSNLVIVADKGDQAPQASWGCSETSSRNEVKRA